MKAVAAGDEAGLDPMLPPVLRIADPGRVALDVVQRHVGRLVDDLESPLGCRLHEVAGELGLAVHHHLLAGEAGNVDPDQPLAVGEVEAVVRQALAVHALGQAEPVHQAGGHGLEHAGPDPREHIFGGLALDDHHLDPLCP